MTIDVYPSPIIPVDVTNPISDPVNVSSTNNFYLDMAKGNVDGHTITHKFGRNETVPIGAWEGVLQLSTSFVWLTTAVTIRVKSGGDANDTAAGTGAQAVTVFGLDENGAAATEDIELAGASVSSATSTTFTRVYRAWIADGRAGAYTGNNVGDIVIEDSGGVADLIMIAATEGQTQYCAFTIPLGLTGYLMSIQVQADGLKAADFRLCVREDILDTSTPFQPNRLKFFWDGVLGQSTLQPATPILVLPALTDIWIEARGGGAQTEVSADMEIILDST
jgi:hypothetical protein